VSAQTRRYLAAVDTSGALTSFNPGMNSNVFGLSSSAGAVYATGNFTGAGSSTRIGTAALDFLYGGALDWMGNVNIYGRQPFLTVTPATGRAIAVRSGIVYVGGSFTGVNGTPHSFLFGLPEPSDLGVSPQAGEEPRGSLRVSPNPSDGDVAIHLAFSAPPGRTRVGIFDSQGRRVRTIEPPLRPWTSCDLTWNGRNEYGQLVAPGIYFVRARSAGGSLQGKLLRVR